MFMGAACSIDSFSVWISIHRFGGCVLVKGLENGL